MNRLVLSTEDAMDGCRVDSLAPDGSVHATRTLTEMAEDWVEEERPSAETERLIEGLENAISVLWASIA